MSDHKLIMESWRNFFGGGSRNNPSNLQPRTNYDMFTQSYDHFYYRLYDGSTTQQMAVDDLARKIVLSTYPREGITVRPMSLSPVGEFYSWKKFKFLKEKVEAYQPTWSSPPAQFSLGSGGEITRTDRKSKPAKSKAIDAKKMKSELALAVVSKDAFEILVLYHAPTIQGDGYPLIIGMIALSPMKPNGPCIPNTLQVRLSAVEERFQRSGFGTILYKMAAAHAKVTLDGGITSDHFSSTSSDAERRWDSIESNPEFYKRETDAGSDTFDYNGQKTPDDPDDDCKYLDERPAVSHSYGVSDKAIEIYEDLKNADHNAGGYGLKNDPTLYQKAIALFHRNY